MGVSAVWVGPLPLVDSSIVRNKQPLRTKQGFSFSWNVPGLNVNVSEEKMLFNINTVHQFWLFSGWLCMLKLSASMKQFVKCLYTLYENLRRSVVNHIKIIYKNFNIRCCGISTRSWVMGRWTWSRVTLRSKNRLCCYIYTPAGYPVNLLKVVLYQTHFSQ